MGRKFTRDKLERAHRRLNDWQYWLSKANHSSALGVQAVDYNATSSGVPAGAICPEIMTPIPIRKTEEAYNGCTCTVRRNIDSYYFLDKEDPNYTKVTKGQREHFLLCISKRLFT